MAVKIRLLGRGDAHVFDNVEHDVFDGPIRPELAKEFLDDPRHHIVVATDEGGRVIGMASGVHYVHPDKPAELFINEVAVAASHQNRGIGRQVLDELLAYGRLIGCREAWVATESSNAAARALYRSTGGLKAPDSIVMYAFDLAEQKP